MALSVRPDWHKSLITTQSRGSENLFVIKAGGREQTEGIDAPALA